MVKVANGGIEETLKGSCPNALQNTCSKQAAVAFSYGSGPSTGCDADADADEEQVSLPPDSAARDKEDGGRTCTKEEVAAQESNVCEVTGEEQREGDGVRSENGTEGGRKDASEAERKGDEVAAPQGPVERVVRVI